MMGISIEEKNLLLVEGKDEELFFKKLIHERGVSGVQVIGIAGKEKLKNNLKALVRQRDFETVERIGIVRDADDQPQGALQSVKDALSLVGLPVPSGTGALTDTQPKTGVLVVPDANRNGALEDLCIDSVAGDTAMPCVEELFGCLEKSGVESPSHLSKAKVQVFLASRRKLKHQLGIAAQAGVWPLDSSAFTVLHQFLAALADSGDTGAA